MDPIRFLERPPRFLFFTGKGGVGKTSIACATALQLTRSGKHVLLVSTDPASNVGQVFGISIGDTVTAIDQVPGLSALEIDPTQAAEAYRDRVLAPVRGLLPDRELASITEQLSGACTTEIASFNEFTELLTSATIRGQYDHVVFDTAPTGHTIRLLQLPGSWTEFLSAGKGDASCLGPLAGLEKQRATYREAVETLSDPNLTRMVLVARAQTSALAEVGRTFGELHDIGMTNNFLVINGVMPELASTDELVDAIREREARAVAAMPTVLRDLPRDLIDLKSDNMVGLAALENLLGGEPSMTDVNQLDLPLPPASELQRLLAQLAENDHGLVMCMGKGGVGKTTFAAAIAVGLARSGQAVLLTTTDPAGDLHRTLPDGIPGLRVERIDPEVATREYRQRVMATKGKDLDEAGRRVLAEDSESLCTEEVAVFHQFSKAVLESRRRFVIIDTAPTGHTLLLLDAAGSYHRDVARQMGEGMTFSTPLLQLQDPTQTKVIVVTTPEPTPVLEALDLQLDLQRAGINPWAWVVNNSLVASQPAAPLLRQRARSEYAQIDRVIEAAPRIALVPMLAVEPVGDEALTALIGARYSGALR